MEVGEEMVLFDFSAKNLANGLYFVTLRSEGAVLTKRLVKVE
ncbi:MAG: T9SS type A sorting domain-containing protein [Saprospiraceae bacterium]